MGRNDDRFKEAYNAMLDSCEELGVGAQLPSEVALAAELEVSRTIVRAALSQLDRDGLLSWSGREKTILRLPTDEDRHELAAPPPSEDELENQFFDWLLRFDVPAGTPLNVAQLSRQFSVAPYYMQEYLSSLSRFGLVRRRKPSGWILIGFTPDFAVELSDYRSLHELHAVSLLVDLPEEHPIWNEIEDLRKRHVELLSEIEEKYQDFSRLDEEFHYTVNSVARNRFIKVFQSIVSMVFHYHYHWRKDTEQARNEAAIKEHLLLIDALQNRDKTAAVAAARSHLDTAKQTLLKSMRYNEVDENVATIQS